MPYDWIDPHQGNMPQVNREDAALSDAEKAVAEERSRGLRVPGIKPGMLVGEKDAQRGVAATDPRGMVFDKDTSAPRAVTDDDFEPPKRSRTRARQAVNADDESPAKADEE